MKFSVIVPVYNAEKYISRCIKSILQQSCPNFELLLIDDGSKDKSGSICDEFSYLDSRIKVFHKVNSGVSATRNLGIKNAIGDYIVFVDSDDYIDADFLAQFELNLSDLVIGGYTLEGFNIKNAIKKTFNTDYNFSNKKEMRLIMFEDGLFNYACTKCFKTSIIKNNNIYFDECLSFAEDTLFVVQYLSKCKDIKVIDNFGYHYVKYQTETLSHVSLGTKNYIKNVEMANEKIYSELIKLYGDSVYKYMNHRMGKMYKDIVYTLINQKGDYSLIKFLYKQPLFLLTLNDVDEIFSQDANLFRYILKLRRPTPLWVFIKYKYFMNK